jgi:hypothetical protein
LDVDYLVTDETPTEIFPGYFGYPAAWKRLNQIVGNILDAETADWKSQLLDARSSEDMPTSGSVTPQPVPATKSERRALVDEFITAVSKSTGRTIKRKDIWTAAGYSNATEFERFQRNAMRTTSSALDNFSRVLNMKPEDFLRLLDKKRPRK